MWRVAWELELPSDIRPLAVLPAGDRLVVHGVTGWLLSGTDGRMLASGLLDSSDLAVDPPGGLFYFVDGAGSLAARRLSDGGRAASLGGPGSGYEVRFIAGLQDRLALLGIARPKDPHGGFHPNRSLIQLHDVSGIPAGGRSSLVRELNRETLSVCAAIREPGLVIAVPGWIYFADAGLNFRGALEGSFEPLAMSLDEHGRAYLIVRDKGRLALWLVMPNGERVFDFPLPPGLRAGAVPPVIAYDHRIFVFSMGRVLAISPGGKLLWDAGTSGQLTGASVTSDDSLLYAEGRRLVAVGRDDKRETIAQLPESIETPAALLLNGDIVVASRSRLYRLTPELEN
jgi:hypothetical protein